MAMMSEQTRNHEHYSPDQSNGGFGGGLVVHEVGALHSHRGDDHCHPREEDAENQHRPGRLDLI